MYKPTNKSPVLSHANLMPVAHFFLSMYYVPDRLEFESWTG